MFSGWSMDATLKMNPQRFALPVQYLRLIADDVRARGADVSRWLRSAGLTEQKLDEPSLEIPFALFEKLVSSALVVTPEPAAGLLFGQKLQMSMHGVLGYAAASSGSLREALGLFVSFSRLRFSPVAISSDEGPREVRVRFSETESLGAIRRPVLEALMMAAKNLLSALTMDACRISRVAFPFDPPGYANLARELFGCEVRYRSTWAGFTLPREALDMPLRTADPIAFREATLICQRELERQGADSTFSGRVRRLLLEHQNGFPTLAVTARLLHETPRTLHRRLTSEGSSFQALLEDVRHTLALEYLKVGRLSVEEVAYRLGYTDLSNFRRAFKRWVGMPPSEYRDRYLRDPTPEPQPPRHRAKPAIPRPARSVKRSR
jgi:AraC-like DNA-binding protein